MDQMVRQIRYCDADGCSDAKEAGFTDADGSATTTYNTNGILLAMAMPDADNNGRNCWCLKM